MKKLMILSLVFGSLILSCVAPMGPGCCNGECTCVDCPEKRINEPRKPCPGCPPKVELYPICGTPLLRD